MAARGRFWLRAGRRYCTESPRASFLGVASFNDDETVFFSCAFALDCEYSSYARSGIPASLFACADEMSHGTRFGATRDFKRHTLKKKFRRGGRAGNQFRRDAWPGLLQEVNEKAHNHLGSRMGRCVRIFGPFPSLFLVSLAQASLSLRKTRQAACMPHRERIWPCKSPGASLLRCVGRARRQPGRRPPMVPKTSTSAAP